MCSPLTTCYKIRQVACFRTCPYFGEIQFEVLLDLGSVPVRELVDPLDVRLLAGLVPGQTNYRILPVHHGSLGLVTAGTYMSSCKGHSYHTTPEY